MYSFCYLNQSVVPCPVRTVASWPAYRFLKRQVRWSGIPSLWEFSTVYCASVIGCESAHFPIYHTHWMWILWFLTLFATWWLRNDIKGFSRKCELKKIILKNWSDKRREQLQESEEVQLQLCSKTYDFFFSFLLFFLYFKLQTYFFLLCNFFLFLKNINLFIIIGG